MSITQVSASASVTINLSNYNSLRAEVTLTATVDAGESADGVHKELVRMARAQLYRDHVKPALANVNKPLQDQWEKFFN